MKPKRERELVFNSVFCDTNLYPGGPMTVSEAKKIGPSRCPHFDECNEDGFLHSIHGHQCAMNMGLQVAQFAFALKEGHSIAREMTDFQKENFHPEKGWVFSSDRVHFEIAPSDAKAHLGLIEKFAYFALGLEPPKRLATEVGPNFSDVVAYATIHDGLAIDLSKMEELEGRFGYNGGKGCDVRSGPCSCDAWH